jgi:F-box interacting protein
LQFKEACEPQTLSRRFILRRFFHSSDATPQLEYWDVEATSFQENFTIRELDFPIGQGSVVNPLCSCNGLVCVGLGLDLDRIESLYMWNPSIGFTHRLPDPCYSLEENLWQYGFGYVSATDDYKLFLVVVPGLVLLGQMFSSRARNWKKIEAHPLHSSPMCEGVHLNEALHWLNWIHPDCAEPDSDDEEAIIAFDLAREEFWEMPVPFVPGLHKYRYTEVGVSCDGCLCLICSPLEFLISAEFWVMREYGKGDSWTKLYNLKNPPEHVGCFIPILIMQTCVVVMMHAGSGLELVRIDHHEGRLGETSTVAARVRVPGNRCEMIGYEESLFWLGDYLGV